MYLSNHGIWRLDIYGETDGTAMWESVDVMEKLMRGVSAELFGGNGRFQVIPCDHLADPGVSGVFLGLGRHFTCHTFNKRNAAFLDVYGLNNDDSVNRIWNFETESKSLQEFVSKYYPSRQMVLVEGSEGAPNGGRYGKHLYFKCQRMKLSEAIQVVEQLLVVLDMKKLIPLMVEVGPSEEFDLLQTITESHIACHVCGECMDVDIFSCRDFPSGPALGLFPEVREMREYRRGSLLDRTGVY